MQPLYQGGDFVGMAEKAPEGYLGSSCEDINTYQRMYVLNIKKYKIKENLWQIIMLYNTKRLPLHQFSW